ncbi:2-oxoglutarate dehydrogenase, E2 component, dihydrolipoamide succinyltransferase [Agromyces kandeliae]|uniref:Dihydrolipoamide acetyltransferase component of pyruvate dehydrogenase complex n=1 Tax=Agromyces kandeliae TaxID=2666141 RepID=A0A6L5QXZ9_9MICO|nr:2-oxoglutarate dehydrogenase, E2 component, dihydrolipoamide succinyltransferase [Agromyces kandeliae]MRX42533.1 2-oxoglutarate dehydrogenase, E2 component, dihydrolipoamide succinyltransferase [Agromyces kandeliae]
MSESVSLPALGESVTEGTVTRWLKNVGDRVEVDEPLLEVSTDKVDTEIPSPVAGVIEAILVQEDETVEVGTALVTIGDGSGGGEAAPAEAPQAEAAPAPAQEAAPAPAPAPAEPAPAAQEAPAPQQAPAPAQEAPAPAAPAQEAPAPQQAPATPAPQQAPAAPAPQQASAAPAAQQAPAQEAPAPQQGGSHAGTSGYVTPIVRKLANEQGVDLASVTGTGVGGRIRKQDVLSAGSPAAAAEAPAAKAERQPLETSPLRGTTQPMTRLRKVVAERAVVSMQSTAQLTSVVEVDVTRVARLRDRVKGTFQEKTGTKLSFLPFFALAAVEALRAYPIINSTVDGDAIVYPERENLSIAVDTERGLLTPVVRDAGELDIAGLAGQIADLAERTRNNQLKPDELAGGTFTLTNTGSRGALFDTPVVFLPQTAILGTGVVVKRPVVISEDGSDAIAIRSMVYLALSYDHRIIDGADAARFLTAVKARLEEGDFEGDLGI